MTVYGRGAGNAKTSDNAVKGFDTQMTQNLLRQSGHGINQAEMLRVADLVTNPSTEFMQQQRDGVSA